MNAIDRFCDAVESARVAAFDGFAPDVELDATVPNWRFTVRGDAVRRQMAGWFADAGRFEQLSRTPLPDGELVEFLLKWTENGVEHAAHQAHILTLLDGKIVKDVMFCGGRWPAPLLEEMSHAH